MRLTPTLLSRLNTPISADPIRFAALSIGCAGGDLSWTVADGVLTVSVISQAPVNAQFTLSDYTLAQLVDAINATSGLWADVLDVTRDSLSSQVLIDASGSGVMSDTGGAAPTEMLRLFGFTSLMWAFMDALALELTDAASAVSAAIDQMDLTKAEGEWLDEWGSFFDVARYAGEMDAAFLPRIQYEPFEIRCNGVALEELIERQTGISVQVRTLDWRVTNWLTTNKGPRLYQGKPVYDQVTNSPDWLAAPHAPTDPRWEFLASLGITRYADGTDAKGGFPFYGAPANGNALNCAFAVLQGTQAISANDQQTIKGIVDRARAQGTLAMYFAPTNLLHTNVSGETDNSSYLSAPAGGTYQQITV